MTFTPKSFEDVLHGMRQAVYKTAPGVCHAKVGCVAGTDISKALCGVLGASTSFYNRDTRLLTPYYTTFHYEVSCEFCKDHKQWELWVLDRTSV